MPIIAAARNIGQKPVTFSSVFHAASIVPPAGIAFPYLHRTAGRTKLLNTNEGATVALGPDEEVALAYGAMTCVAVCYFSSSGRGIPANQIVEITDLFQGQFAMNNNLELGY
ncbi:hypothetical protein [Sorangium sp. So ce693]|uniref:hypothetical protein n=1 Tax=Sorangium sp. So ce693 TaxID=3133318 RepID=UPI003F61BD5D